MNRSRWVAVLAAGGLLVAGCSSGSGTTASSTSAATSASSAASSSKAATSAAGSGSVAPADLDADSTGWFDALCGGLAPTIKDLSTLGQNATADPAAAQAEVVAKVEAASVAFGETAATLAATPLPTFDGGAELATAITGGLQTAAANLPASAATYAAVNPADATALQAGEQALAGDLTAALTPLQGLSQLAPDVQAAVKTIPACQALGS